jgi:hypothetical protein
MNAYVYPPVKLPLRKEACEYVKEALFAREQNNGQCDERNSMLMLEIETEIFPPIASDFSISL